MSSILPWFRSTLAVGSLALLGATAAQAEAVSFFVPYEGGGNVSVFDAPAGTGGWVGSIVQSPDPAVTSPLSLVSVVLFTVDELSKTLSGTFEFTTTDLLSTLFGELSGSFVEDDILTAGGQFSIDYTVQGGTGQFSRATGFGLARQARRHDGEARARRAARRDQPIARHGGERRGRLDRRRRDHQGRRTGRGFDHLDGADLQADRRQMRVGGRAGGQRRRILGPRAGKAEGRQRKGEDRSAGGITHPPAPPRARSENHDCRTRRSW